MTTDAHRQATHARIAADIRRASIEVVYLSSLTLDGAVERWEDLWEQGRTSEAKAWWTATVLPRMAKGD